MRMTGLSFEMEVGTLADDDQIAAFGFALDGSRRHVLDLYGREDDPGSAARISDSAEDRLDLVPQLLEDYLVACTL